MKRGERQLFFFALVILFSLVIIGFVLAQENGNNGNNMNAATSEEGGGQIPVAETQADNTAVSDESSSQETSAVTSESTDTETIADDSGSTPSTASDSDQDEFNVEPGMTPDNPLYFIKDTYQQIVVGDNPERALAYREQKIAEAEVMIEKEKPEEAKRVLDRALQYGDIVEKEISPEIKEEVAARSERVQNAMENLREKTEDNEVREKFDENLRKEKKIETAGELVAKINELCGALAKLDPLQYADTCKPETDSPRWMRENDREITKEQKDEAKIFFNKISECFENPEKCDCRGMGVQKFEDFCIEKSALAVKCENDDESACSELEKSDPSDLLPDYLIPVFRDVEKRYMKSQFDMYMPEECAKAGAKTPEDCNSVMFKLNSPKECTDAGLTGRTKEDEIKCKRIMFEKNSPKECTDAGIDPGDKDAPRKCSKIMFQKYAAKECIDAGLTGESREDQRKCNELLSQNNLREETNGESRTNFAPKFSRDCNAISDTAEKVKCYEEFYNNAQVQMKDDFREREFAVDRNTGETITQEEERARQECRDKGMATTLEYENGRRVIVCVDKNSLGNRQFEQKCPDGTCDDFEKNNPDACPEDCGGTRCQSNNQIDRLKEDCKSRGQDAIVETRGGCPWVICASNYPTSAGGGGGGQARYVYQPNQQQNIEQPNVQQPNQGTKCPDNICDEYEQMNPYACPDDCGGARNQPQQPSQPPQNIIDNPQEPNQQPSQFCSGEAPSCAPNGAPFCDNGNWVCPQPQQQPIEQQPIQQPIEQQPIAEQPVQQPIEQQPIAEQPVPVQEPAPATSGGGGGESSTTTAPVTGGAISQNSENDLNRFLAYWWR